MKPEASDRHKVFLSILWIAVTSFMLSGCMELVALSNLYMGSSPSEDIDQQVAELRAGYNYSHIPDHIDIKGFSEPQVDSVLEQNHVFVRHEMRPKTIQNQYWKVWKIERWMPTIGGHFLDYSRYILFINGHAIDWFTEIPRDYLAAVPGASSILANGLLTSEEQLGKSIFFDVNLSINQNQSCAVCHGPEAGWTGPDSAINAHGSVYEGSFPGRFGDKKPPSVAYATLSPVFHLDKKGLFVGGNFWDGRATGEMLGNPAADQALGPFLNPKAQALPDSACVVYRVCNPVVPADYPVGFEEVWNEESCDISWPTDVEIVCATEGSTVGLSDADRATSDRSYGQIGLTVAAYEDSAEVNAFSSKHDQTYDGKVKLNKQEQWGFALFRGKGKCALCHTANGRKALFTDFTFDNLGLPQNPENPAGMAPDFVDPGLGGFLKNAGYDEDVYIAEWGKHKVPTLRNVGKGSCEAEPGNPNCVVKTFGHNGYFKSLEGIVHFYNTRDVKEQCLGAYTEAEALAANCWPAPEFAENINTDELGDLGLTLEEEDAIVAFMKALSDGYQP